MSAFANKVAENRFRLNLAKLLAARDCVSGAKAIDAAWKFHAAETEVPPIISIEIDNEIHQIFDEVVEDGAGNVIAAERAATLRRAWLTATFFVTAGAIIALGVRAIAVAIITG